MAEQYTVKWTWGGRQGERTFRTIEQAHWKVKELVAYGARRITVNGKTSYTVAAYGKTFYTDR